MTVTPALQASGVPLALAPPLCRASVGCERLDYAGEQCSLAFHKEDARYLKAIRADLKLLTRIFLLQPASQLYCVAGGAFVPSGGANGDT